MRRIGIGLACLLGLALPLCGGCASWQAKSIEEQKATLKMYAEMAREMGAEVYVYAEVPNEGYIKQSIGTNGELHVFMRVNPGE